MYVAEYASNSNEEVYQHAQAAQRVSQMTWVAEQTRWFSDQTKWVADRIEHQGDPSVPPMEDPGWLIDQAKWLIGQKKWLTDQMIHLSKIVGQSIDKVSCFHDSVKDLTDMATMDTGQIEREMREVREQLLLLKEEIAAI